MKIQGPYRPQYQTEGSAGFDLVAYCLDSPDMAHWEIAPGGTMKIPVGLRMEIPDGWEVQIRPRSGLSSRGIFVQFGTVDSDYRGEVSVIVYNSTGQPFVMHKGMRIAQGVFCPATRANFEFVKKVSQTARGSGGFGSTGI